MANLEIVLKLLALVALDRGLANSIVDWDLPSLQRLDSYADSILCCLLHRTEDMKNMTLEEHTEISHSFMDYDQPILSTLKSCGTLTHTTNCSAAHLSNADRDRHHAACVLKPIEDCLVAALLTILASDHLVRLPQYEFSFSRKADLVCEFNRSFEEMLALLNYVVEAASFLRLAAVCERLEVPWLDLSIYARLDLIQKFIYQARGLLALDMEQCDSTECVLKSYDCFNDQAQA